MAAVHTGRTEGLVREAAVAGGLPGSRADDLTARWHELQPWPEVGTVLGALAGRGLLLGLHQLFGCFGRARGAAVGCAGGRRDHRRGSWFYKPHPAPSPCGAVAARHRTGPHLVRRGLSGRCAGSGLGRHAGVLAQSRAASADCRRAGSVGGRRYAAQVSGPGVRPGRRGDCSHYRFSRGMKVTHQGGWSAASTGIQMK